MKNHWKTIGEDGKPLYKDNEIYNMATIIARSDISRKTLRRWRNEGRLLVLKRGKTLSLGRDVIAAIQNKSIIIDSKSDKTIYANVGGM